MKIRSAVEKWLALALGAAVASHPATILAENLVLAAEGRSNYQLVVPDGTGDERIDESLHLAARLIQTAFKASGFELPIAREGERAPDKPGIYLGATAFALQNGCDPAALEGWDYYHKVVDPDVVIVGRDHAPPPVPAGLGDRAFFYRMATVKGVADFLRMHCGTYFLFPGGTFIPSAAATPRKDFELLLTPDIEYRPMERIEVPRDLQLRKHFFVVYNFRNTKECSLYDIANNLFPRVDDAYFAHTYDKAVPASKYRQTHPEYFALQGGERTTQNHYCISNPGFQETLFQWTKQWLDLGFKSVNILHQDGFRPCQCADCAALYGTGTDWGEKLWIMQRNMAERLWKEHPGKTFLMVPYTVTQNPPASFDEFPSNVAIRAQGTNLEAFEPWKRFEARRNLPIPRGFASGLHNWIANQSSSYTPQRTPLFVEQQVRMFHANNVTATTRDGQGYMFGLEGPTFYVFGRMFDDPEKLDAKTLLFEFCDAAFGNAAPSMRHFYDALYDSIEIYALYLSTHGIAWSYTDIYGRRHKAIRDPFRMLGFLYPPRLLNTLEQHLAQAEAQARADKHKARLRLVRRELDYLKATLRVVHLHHAYEIEPNLAARDRLLDAIDARNAFLGSIFTFRPRRQGDGASPAPIDGWDHVLFPRPGHSPAHLRLAYNDYGNPFENTAFNWDTAAVRSAPLPGTERQTALAAPGAVSIDTPLWDTAPAAELKPAMPSGKTMPATAFRVLHGPEHVHLLIRAGLARGQSAFDDAGRDGKMNGAEAVDVYLAPDPAREVFYRFTVGPHPGSKYDAARGLIADQMHPRFNLDDSDWNGEWTYESRLDPRGRLWTALLSIPYSTLETVRPTEDATWRVNVARTHVPAPDQLEQAIWSTLGSTRNVGDRNALGELIFRAGIETGSAPAAAAAELPITTRRKARYEATFLIPRRWEALPHPLPAPLGPWLFRLDPLEKGVPDEWYRPDADTAAWEPIDVPAYWDEFKWGRFEGQGWYRTTFHVPAGWSGHALQLLFGSVDEEAWVYVNGKPVGEHSQASTGMTPNELCDEPFEVHVPPAGLNFGADNTLAVRVNNTKGGGGIWRPVLGHRKEP